MIVFMMIHAVAEPQVEELNLRPVSRIRNSSYDSTRLRANPFPSVSYGIQPASPQLDILENGRIVVPRSHPVKRPRITFAMLTAVTILATFNLALARCLFDVDGYILAAIVPTALTIQLALVQLIRTHHIFRAFWTGFIAGLTVTAGLCTGACFMIDV